jgi:hypothetical protein
VTVTVAVTGLFPSLIAVNVGISPESDSSKLIPVKSFSQLNTVVPPKRLLFVVVNSINVFQNHLR